MFLDLLLRRNEPLITAAVELHQRGEIPANSYVLDVDAIGSNARLIAEEASRLNLRVYAMTKQFGRCPVAVRALLANGIDAGVAVDMACAKALAAAGAKVGNVGHLVQVPRHAASEAAAMEPEYWTVFNLEKAREAGAAAAAIGHSQALLARIYDPQDRFYPGHEGGFPAADVLHVAETLGAVDGARFGGLTTFPALLFDVATERVKPTPNLATLARVAETLAAAGHSDVAVNAPGTTSRETLQVLADAGATQVEPGHALTGTTPLHAKRDLPERPAMLYLTEVSHQYAGRSYCFGGGLYIDPVFPPYQVTALVGREPHQALFTRVDAELPSADAIDYYAQLDALAQPGDTVLFGFRAQAFVTRAFIAPVSGIDSGTPRVEGLWAPDGREVTARQAVGSP